MQGGGGLCIIAWGGCNLCTVGGTGERDTNTNEKRTGKHHYKRALFKQPSKSSNYGINNPNVFH